MQYPLIALLSIDCTLSIKTPKSVDTHINIAVTRDLTCKIHVWLLDSSRIISGFSLHVLHVARVVRFKKDLFNCVDLQFVT